MSALTSSASANVSLPSTASPANKGIIAPFWDDMSYSRASGTFRFAEVVQGGQKVAVLQWTNLSPFDGASTIKVTFQAQLWQNGDIVFVYQDMQGDTTFSQGSSATIGIQAPGTSGTPPAIQYSFNTASVTTGKVLYFKKL